MVGTGFTANNIDRNLFNFPNKTYLPKAKQCKVVAYSADKSLEIIGKFRADTSMVYQNQQISMLGKQVTTVVL